MGRVRAWVICILTFYYIIANYYLEDLMLVVIVLLGGFLHSALGSNAIQETQISKSTDRFVASHSMWI